MLNTITLVKRLLMLSMAIALVACNAHNREHQKLMGVYKTGPYRVGFRSLAVRDSMRTIGDSAYRPVQIGFWYPRKAGDQMRFMTFRNYFLLSAQEMGPGKLNSDSLIGNYKKLAVRFGVTKHGIDSLFSMSFIAKDGAPVRGGNFPMVLVGQGNMQTIFHQVVLCEYLASHGFYVVTTPSPTRITGFYKGYNGLVAKAREQGADLAFARRKILQITDRKNIPTGIVAYSFSARAALLYAVKHSGLKAFISLDGGIGNKMGKEWIDYVDDFDPGQITVPILHIYQPGDEVVQPDFDLIKSLGSPTKKFVEVDSVNHEFFTVMGAADGAIPLFMARPYPNAKSRYQEVLDSTNVFLEKYLKSL